MKSPFSGSEFAEGEARRRNVGMQLYHYRALSRWLLPSSVWAPSCLFRTCTRIIVESTGAGSDNLEDIFEDNLSRIGRDAKGATEAPREATVNIKEGRATKDEHRVLYT